MKTFSTELESYKDLFEFLSQRNMSLFEYGAGVKTFCKERQMEDDKIWMTAEPTFPSTVTFQRSGILSLYALYNTFCSLFCG